MMGLPAFEVALAAGAVLLALEVVSGSFVFLSFGVGCFAVAAAQAFGGGLRVGRDVAVFVAVAVVAVLVLRWAFGRSGDSTRAKGDVNDY